MSSGKRPATYEDLCAVPDHLVAEIVDGELVVSPRPALRHALVTSRLGSQLGGAFDGPANGPDAPGGWIVLDEPELHFGADVLVPGLAGWRRSRVPRLPDAPWLAIAPDWLCEVLSPGNTALADAGRWVLRAVHEGDGPVRAEPFDAAARWRADVEPLAEPTSPASRPG